MGTVASNLGMLNPAEAKPSPLQTEQVSHPAILIQQCCFAFAGGQLVYGGHLPWPLPSS